MEAQHLINNGLVWLAAEDHNTEDPEYSSPESILAQGFSHEFFFKSFEKSSRIDKRLNKSTNHSVFNNRASLIPPVSALLPFIKTLNRRNKSQNGNDRYVVFLGKEVWPTPFCLRDVFSSELPLTKFIFIDPNSEKHRRRSLEILASSSNVLAVITYLEKIPFPFTQKLFLLSKQSNAYTFIFRENKEIHTKSAAFSRWAIAPVVSNTDFPSWNISLQHSKGISMGERMWLMEGVNEKEVSVHLLSQLGARFGTANVTDRRCA